MTRPTSLLDRIRAALENLADALGIGRPEPAPVPVRVPVAPKPRYPVAPPRR